jgi:hypothetical protein
MMNPMSHLKRLSPMLLNQLKGGKTDKGAAAQAANQVNPHADAFERAGRTMGRGAARNAGTLQNAGSEASQNFRLSSHLGVRSKSIDWDRGGRAGYSKGWVDTKHDHKTFADTKWTNRPDQENAENKTGIPISATLFNIGARREATVASVRAEATVAGANLSGEVYAGRLRGTTTLGASADLNTMTLKVDAGLRAEAHLLGVQASGKRKFGSDAINTTTTVSGNAYVGAEAGAKAGVNFNPRSGDVGVSAGLDAFAGAKAKGVVRQSLGLAGENIGRAGVSGEAWAGIGASANASAGFEDGKFKLSGSLGAALGLGGKVGFSVEVDVVGTGRAITNTASAAVDIAADAGESVANAFSSGWSAVKKLW